MEIDECHYNTVLVPYLWNTGRGSNPLEVLKKPAQKLNPGRV